MDPISLPISGAQIFEPGAARTLLETDALARYLPECRWFGGKAREPQSFAIEDLVAMGIGDGAARLALVRAEYASGPGETYLVPLRLAPAGAGDATPIATFADGTALFEALHDEGFRAGLLRLIANGETLGAADGEVVGVPGSGLPAGAAGGMPSRVLPVEQSNSSLIYGDQIFVKLFRKLEEGMNPDVEITQFLSERQRFPHVPPFAGSIEFRRAGREPRVLALALGLVPNDGDAWAFTLREVAAFYARVQAGSGSAEGLTVGGLFEQTEDPAGLVELVGTFAARVRQLGERTGQMHRALAAEATDPAFAPEPFTAEDLRALGTALRRSTEQLFETVRRQADSGAEGQRLLGFESDLLRRVAAVGSHEIHAAKTRTHGDYHLGQVLNTGDDFVLIDFEGEPQRSLAYRKEKRSPLRDVAGMLRSFHYAAHSGLGEVKGDASALKPWAELWAKSVSRTFLRGWLEATAGAAFVPPDAAETAALLEAFLLEKAIYEVGYELNNRPAWVGIPVQGIAHILGQK